MTTNYFDGGKVFDQLESHTLARQNIPSATSPLLYIFLTHTMIDVRQAGCQFLERIFLSDLRPLPPLSLSLVLARPLPWTLSQPHCSRRSDCNCICPCFCICICICVCICICIWNMYLYLYFILANIPHFRRRPSSTCLFPPIRRRLSGSSAS